MCIALRAVMDEALRVVRARAVARAEIDVFLAVNEVSSFVPAKCAALVRAWGALASMEAVVTGDATDDARVPKALASVPDDFVGTVVACAQSAAWTDAVAPSERQLDMHGRLLLQAFDGLDRRARRSAHAPRFPWPALRRAALVAAVLGLAVACAGFVLYRPRWRASYFANDNLSGNPSVVARAFEADNYWGLGGPGISMPNDRFSARFETCLVADRPLSIRFTVGSDDGSRLFIDGTNVIDAWYPHTYEEREQWVPLAAGTHALRLEYFELEGQARLTFAGRVEGSGADVTSILRLPKGLDGCGTSR
jgi:hypothetical protein